MGDKENISFKPVNSGLGFHPFSDGLPYAPVRKPAKSSSSDTENLNLDQKAQPSKNQPKTHKIDIRPRYPIHRSNSPQSKGATGAQAAGTPQVVSPHQAPKTQWASDLKLQTGKNRVSNVLTQKEKAQITPKLDLPSETEETSSLGFLYLLKRTLAYLSDTFINVLLCGAALGGVMWKLEIPFNQLFVKEIFTIGVLFLFVFNWALIAAQEIAFSTSLGKNLFGLTLEGGFTSVFVRSIFFLLSFGLAGLGLLSALFDSKKRCLHDQISGVQPIEVAKL